MRGVYQRYSSELAEKIEALQSQLEHKGLQSQMEHKVVEPVTILHEEAGPQKQLMRPQMMTSALKKMLRNWLLEK